MKIWAISDIHVDYTQNLKWIEGLSYQDMQNDILLLAGDISDDMVLLEKTFQALKQRFLSVFYIPGNHDLWVRHYPNITSFDKLDLIKKVAADQGILMHPAHFEGVHIVPLYAWYDHSFGTPSKKLMAMWKDHSACKWPNGFDAKQITATFTAMNEPISSTSNKLVAKLADSAHTKTIISFSHFVPNIELMPSRIPERFRLVYPVLGSDTIQEQIDRLGSHIHVYGHSHVNQHIRKDGVLYINNAFGYPRETSITSKQLMCIYET